ncbi:hypothetical protein [Microbacterium sp. BDGP8]|uniref:hypothetical protein n=1 Tax=Microbacterium sp. BDGP8 TaxID=3035531 RepID=UPI00249E0246|nr:hypothetical protein [Microbacterium sp. BDGP8]WHE37817.1 hypothetical protein P6897_15930 [Microbacterium sp. BDGP8]
MEWFITGVLVPVVIAAVTAFGATWYATGHADRRERRQSDRAATDAIRRYIRALSNRADYLEEVAIAAGHWDPDASIIDPGSDEEVRAAYQGAASFFYRLNVGEGERAGISNTMPDLGHHAMEGAGNFAERAELLQQALDRGLLPTQ